MSPLERLRHRLHARRSDRGASLAELLVVSLVSTILLAALGVLFSGSLQASRRASTHTAATAEARLAADAIGRRLRVAVRPSPGAAMFTEATASSMTFFASLSTPGSTTDPLPSQVRYAVDPTAGCLRETVTPAAGPTRTSCLAFGDVTPVFSYYQVTKRPTMSAPSPSPAPTEPLSLSTGSLSATDAAKVGSVALDLSVRDRRAPAAARPVQVTTRVLLVNDLNEETA